MVTCCVLGCKNRSGKVPNGITFHRFPSNPELKAAWVAAVKRRNWQPTAHSSVCSVHFREEDVDRTSLCCVRIRENRVPCLVSVLQMSCRTRARRGPRPSGSPGGSKKVRVLRKRRPLSKVEKTQESNEETALDQLAKVATAVLEAEPKDDGTKRCTRGAASATIGSPGRKRKSPKDTGGKIRRTRSLQEVSSSPDVSPEISERLADVPKDLPRPQEECGEHTSVDEPSSAGGTNESDDRHEEEGMKELTEKDKNCQLGSSSVADEVETNQCSDCTLDRSVERRGDASTNDEGAAEPSPAEVILEDGADSIANNSSSSNANGDKLEAQPLEGSTGNANETTSTGPVEEDDVPSRRGSESNAGEVQQDIMHRPAHLIDHGTMCRKPQSGEPTARIMKSLLTNKHTVQTVNNTSYVTNDQTVKIIYYPAVQSTIPDHTAYCGKVVPAVETTLAAPDHANYTRVVRTIAPGPAPQAVASAVKVPLALSQSQQNQSVSHETPINAADLTASGSESCLHDGIIHKLRAELAKCTEMQTQRRKKMKVLQQSLRRSKRRNEKLEQLVTELRKRPKPEDGDAVREKMGRVCVDLWKRQELKAKGEALPTEYSLELGNFATTLYDYSPEAYEFVRQTFNGCLPHSRTLMKWKSTSRSTDGSSLADPLCASSSCVLAAADKSQEVVVPLVVLNDTVRFEDMIVVQEVDPVTRDNS